MQTYLIVSENSEKGKSFVEDLRKKQNINSVDTTFISSETTFGIEDVRNFQKTVFLKPLKSNEKIIVIENFQTATTEAQNAMLKVLEEPPNNTYIFLLANSTDFLLGTVLSRCLIVKLDNENVKISNDDPEEFKNELDEYEKYNTAEFLKLAQDLAIEKDKAISWLKKSILVYRNKMLTDQNYKYVRIIENLQQAYKLTTTTNINLRFLLENSFLNINI